LLRAASDDARCALKLAPRVADSPLCAHFGPEECFARAAAPFGNVVPDVLAPVLDKREIFQGPRIHLQDGSVTQKTVKTEVGASV
jgi:hypothetical protein